MTQPTAARNPFLLMLNPEVVLAAIEKSEHLSQLNRHLCRPLDRPTQTWAANTNSAEVDSEPGEDFEAS